MCTELLSKTKLPSGWSNICGTTCSQAVQALVHAAMMHGTPCCMGPRT